jgi:UDP-N-acetylmuramate dehydrogenase
MTKLDQLVAKLGQNKCLRDEPVAKYTYMKVGGPADVLYLASSSNDLINAVTIAQSIEVPYTILGNGANALVADRGIRGLTIINKSSQYHFLPHDYLEADSGVSVVELINQTRKRRLTGLERMLKVPATVGGAIFMNAGDTNKQEFFGDLVRSVKILTPSGQLKTIDQKDCDFAYRHSRFQNSGETIVSAVLQLKAVSHDEIEEKARDILIRKINQPAGPSVGSTFRNPDTGHAGALLEKSEMKGEQIGGAKISDKHANFIINLGNATSENIKDLITLMKRRVKDKSQVELKEEVRYIGDWES